jgi:hypothetical protein
VSLRPWLTIGLTLILLGVGGYLLKVEEIAPPEQRARHLQVKQDPLGNVAYTKALREANLKAFGLDDDMVKAAMARIRDLEDRHQPRLQRFLEDAPEPTELAEAICGQTNQVRPRYGALRVLVSEDKGRRQVVDVDRVSGLSIQDWSKISPIAAVYDEVELASERKPDATMMAIAAILVAKEEDLLNKNAPWGSSLAANWSWKSVQKQHPGIRERVVDYFALLHLTVELATADEGICSR